MAEEMPVKIVAKKPFLSVRKVLLALAVALPLVAAVGFGLYFRSEALSQRQRADSLVLENDNLRAQNTDLIQAEQNSRAEIASLKSVGEAMKNEAEKQAAMNEAVNSMSGYLAQKIDDLDAILIDSDQASTDFINWLTENSQFPVAGGVRDDAHLRLGQWQENHLANGVKYMNLKADITDYFTNLRGVMNNNTNAPTGGELH